MQRKWHVRRQTERVPMKGERVTGRTFAIPSSRNWGHKHITDDHYKKTHHLKNMCRLYFMLILFTISQKIYVLDYKHINQHSDTNFVVVRSFVEGNSFVNTLSNSLLLWACYIFLLVSIVVERQHITAWMQTCTRTENIWGKKACNNNSNSNNNWNARTHIHWKINMRKA